MPPSLPLRLGKFAFWLWLAGGVVWISLSGHYGDRLWRPDYIFRFVGEAPEQTARFEEWERMAHFFCWWSIGYASFGPVVFRGRGAEAFVLGLVIVAMSWFVQLATGLGHL